MTDRATTDGSVDDDIATSAVVVQPPPPFLLDLLGPREHVKFILSLSTIPPPSAEEDEDAAARSSDGSSSDSNQDQPYAAQQSLGPANVTVALLSNISNADDAEMNAVIVLDTQRWTTIAALPLIPGLLNVESHSPQHIRVLLKQPQPPSSSQAETSFTEEKLFEGWSEDILLLQDLRLLLSAPATTDVSPDSSLAQFMLTRWMWLKRYCSAEQFAAIKRILRDRQDRIEKPVWGLCELCKIQNDQNLHADIVYNCRLARMAL